MSDYGRKLSDLWEIKCLCQSFNILGNFEIFISQDKPCDKDFGIFLPMKNPSLSEEIEEKKQDFCVCVKPLDFPNEPRLARRLTEWIESNLQLGAQKIVIYVYSSKCIHLELNTINLVQ